MRFTPSIDAKKPILHDASAKVHVKFGDDANTTANTVSSDTKPTSPLTSKSTSTTTVNKKRSSDQAEINDKTNNKIHKKQKAEKDTTTLSKKPKATPIGIPGKNTTQKTTPNGANKNGRSKGGKYKAVVKPKLTEEEIKEKVKKIREKKKQRKLAKKVVDGVKVAVPTLRLNPDTLKQKIPLSSIRDFIVNCVTEAAPPSWATITHRAAIKHTVVLFVHGLDITSFGIPEHRNNTPHYVEAKAFDAISTSMGKSAMPFFTHCFSHMMISKITGGNGKVFSAVSELLQCPVGKNEYERKKKDSIERVKAFENNMNEFYMLTLDEMKALGYPIPTFLDPESKLNDDWKETRAVKEPIPKKRLIAIDCEMVETSEGKALARVTLVNEDGNKLLDEYVKPAEPILDYLTQYSGITPEIMKNATCSLRRAQKHVRKYVDHNVILVGHGLENDLRALKLAHPYCADTSILYDSFKGKPFKPALRHLSRNLLKRVIQHESKVGHDSAEDARAALDLFTLKVKKGPDFGRFGRGTELVSDRLHKYNPPKSSILLEASATPNGVYAASHSLAYHHYDNEEALVEHAIEAVKTHDFVFTQFDTLRPSSLKKKKESNDNIEMAPTVVSTEISGNYEEAAKMTRFDSYFQQMYNAFPSGTMVLVLGGLGNVPRYHELYKRFRICQGLDDPPANSDPIEPWTGTDQKRLEGYGAKARLGAVFATIKQ
ncbi:hypothetical protein BDA99DRAFT_527143 [Phascolomyces articulosus]|uniref:Exonuclease domain-containing protein n=1 Tax=Phascolomyces articulosus TaxID=60185 RepID=A0AAD5JMI9_9FUNG|nr:hypothetical protein BDA99DRAFT_527143 [Phascolomyces articulosus]